MKYSFYFIVLSKKISLIVYKFIKHEKEILKNVNQGPSVQNDLSITRVILSFLHLLY